MSADGGFRPDFTLYLDGLSLVMLWVITGVGFLIHVYATGYMAGDPGFARFFAYMNLFVFAMLMLVLADDLLVLVAGSQQPGAHPTESIVGPAVAQLPPGAVTVFAHGLGTAESFARAVGD